MIPVEVTLSNFLGYDDNDGEGYTYNFADHRLWSISGDNGAGKSAIFDSITYCLFGKHRGGAQRDEELLHKGASNMSCSFTFDHFDTRYCIRRTLTKRTRRTGAVTTEKACQIEWYDAAEGAWRAIDGTTTVAGLEDYVRTRLLGFDYDTFISSVLLLQGQSDKLIAAYPAQRFDYLSGILEFDRYRRLCGKSEDRMRDFRSRHEVLVHQLGQVQMPSDQQVQDAEKAATEADQLYQQASACNREKQQRYERVKGYHDLAARQWKLAGEVKEAEAAIERAPEIRAAAKTWDRLRVALPLLRSAYNELCDAAAADESATVAKANADMIDLAKLQAALSTSTADLETATKAHEANANELRECRQRLQYLQPRLTLARRLNELDGQISNAGERVVILTGEMAAFGDIETQKERVDLLYRCLTSVQAYVKARKSREELLAGRTPATLKRQLEQAGVEHATAVTAMETLQKVVAGRREAIAAMKQRLVTLKAEHEQRVEAGDEGTCSRCGQTVSPEHIRTELARCTAEISQVETEIADAKSELAADDADLQDARAKLPAAATAEQEARDQLRRFTECQAEVDRLDAAPFMAELPDDCCKAVQGPVDLAVTAVAGFENEVGDRDRLAKEHNRLRALEADRRSQEQLVANFEAERSKILDQITGQEAQVALAASAELAEKVQDCEANEVALATEAYARADARDQARTAHNEGQLAKAQLESDAKSASVEADAKRRSAEQLVAVLDTALRPPSFEKIQELEVRFEELAGAPAELAALASAESELATWRGQLLEAGEAIARVPEDERVALDVAATDLQAARQAEAMAETTKNSARDTFKETLRIRGEHIERKKEADLVDQQRQVWQRLARLLGRSGLQLALLKRDLFEIERRANPFLQQISGGGLSLSIECGEGRGNREEILFKCVDAASADGSLDVAFLSGGQKFRVAVALAAGIGQYAGLGASMPSQIIDEGFGSLDETGRKEMLEAIRDMSEHYERIIVVSHTDSFHDPSLFPARYELRKEGRRTLVTATV